MVEKEMDEARRYLAANPDAWPYVMAACIGRVGVGPLATAYGKMDADSFRLVCQAGFQEVDSIVAQVSSQHASPLTLAPQGQPGPPGTGRAEADGSPDGRAAPALERAAGGAEGQIPGSAAL
jgi:hypothetical protein